MSKEQLEKRLQELREAEGMAWAQIHAIQGRIAEIEHLLGELAPALTMDQLQDLLPPGDKIDGEPEPIDADSN